jgi:hypothetical protein
MTLSPTQLAQAVAETRKLIAAHSTPFLNYNKMITDQQLTEALTQVLAAVEEKV